MPASGAGGRGFKSRHSDQYFSLTRRDHRGVAQVARVLA